MNFVGSATDAEDDDVALTAAIAWTSNLDGGIGSGGSFSTSSLSVGTHTITASVTDSELLSGSDTISVIITNDSPSVTISSPPTGSSFGVGDSISFAGSATDTEDGTLTASLSWSSSIDGNIGSGGSFSTTGLSAGAHTITASVTDSDTNTGSDTITVTVTNNTPTVNITQPSNGASFAFGTNVTFSATATDAEDGNLRSSLAWASSRDGNIGSGGTFNVNDLSIGSHTITASVTDSNSNTGSDSVSITITNNAPTVTITSPANGTSFPAGTTISFVANATDVEDSNAALTAAIAWSSSLDGSLGTGGSISISNLAVGNHTITASVTDSNGGPASDSISVSVTNTAPTADPQSVSTDEDTSVAITLTGSDPEGDSLTFDISSGPSDGSLSGTAPNVTYTPDENFNGSDSFSFTVNDGQLTSAAATVAINVAPVNDPPVANNDTANVQEDSSNEVIDVTANDTDVDDDPLTVTEATAQNGDAVPSGGNVIYTPDPNFNGQDTINYTISDGNGGTDSAVVTVTVASVEDPPDAVDDAPPAIDEGGTIDGTFNVLDNDDNPETTPMSAVIESPPSNASSFALNGDGTFVYTHDGGETTSDSFTYRANNGQLSNIATVSITINPVNDAPSIIGVLPPGLSTPEDTTLTILVSALDIDDPDSDPSSFALTLDPVLPPDANYTIAGPASITPAENFNGDLSVRATVSDGLADSAPFAIPVTVTAENDRPVLDAEIGPQTAIENSLFLLDVSDNFSDADGDTLTFSAAGLPASGNISIDPVTGIISGTPVLEDARDNDPYVVTVTATDPATPENPAGTSVSDEFDLIVSALDRANVGLTIGVSPESGLPNDQLQWTFTAGNQGPAPGENVELTGSFFGDGLSVAAGSGSSCSINLQTGRADFDCTIGALPVDGMASITFTTTASQATEVVAFGTAAGAQTVPIDPNISDNSAVRSVGVAESFSDGAVQLLGASTIRSVAAGDLDGDGTIDLIVGTGAGQPVQIYLGDEPRESCGCQRDFVSTPLSIPDTGSNEGIAVADFDNDGDLDFVVANGGGQPDAVYSNNGGANFTLATLLDQSNGRDVAVGDFNNDGNADIAIAATSPNPVYFGDGTGLFPTGMLLGDVDSFDVAVGRFDGDAFDDLVFANVGTDSQVWINNGGTGFTPGATLPIGDATSVAAADLNGDNLDDLVFGRIPGGSDDVPANPVLINQGGATFDGPPELLGISPTLDVLIGDVSDDGLPDLVFVNQSGVHQIWTASGGSFVLHSEQIIDIGARAGVLANLGFADTDDPGGADLALGGALGGGTAVYLNDSAGNLGLGDAVAPVIALNGEATVNVPSGEAYSDAGATAADNIDGDISASIVVSNPVNTTVVGAYTVTYNVQDFAGNPAAQVTRTVNVTAATGRGGGGGGSFGYWALALLVAMQLLLLLQNRLAAQTRPTKRT